MGKALILTNSNNGLYRIRLLQDENIINHWVELYQGAIDHVDESIANEQEKAEPNESTLKALELRKAALEKSQANYSNLLTYAVEVNVWCADLSKNLSGEVSTIEIGTERYNGLNIRPGHTDSAEWTRERDGLQAPFLGLSLHNAMLNYCLMPAIQKYRPTYRYGTITGIDYVENTANIELDETLSSQQNIDINQSTTLSNVPVDYMSCNAAAFELDDRVIVEFSTHDWASPKVIGFRDNPKSCSPFIVIVFNGQAIAWDIDSDDIMNISGLSQPAEFSAMVNALANLGYDIQSYQDSTVIGACEINNELKIYEFGDLENKYGAYHVVDESEDMELVDTGETYTAEVQGIVSAVFEVTSGTIDYVLGFIRYINADYEISGTVGISYSACLDDNETTKRKPTLYHASGEMDYSFTQTAPMGQLQSYTVSTSYSKEYHYKSTFNATHSEQSIFTITDSFSGDNNGYQPGEGGWIESVTSALEKIEDFKTDLHVSVKDGSIQNLREKNIAIVIEQPVIHNNDTDENWGFCDIWATNKGTKIDPDDPNSIYNYDYSDLSQLDTDKMYSYFGTTHQTDMESRQTMAGLEVVVFSNE